MLRALALVLLIGCGSSSQERSRPEGTHPPSEGSERAELSDTRASGSSSCPATYDEATHYAGCADGTGAQCSYDDGDCTCVIEHPCTGVDYGDDVESPRVWQCTPAVRADGCPGSPPTAGEACDHAGECSYGPSCCGTGTRARCTQGRWATESFDVDCPPSTDNG